MGGWVAATNSSTRTPRTAIRATTRGAPPYTLAGISSSTRTRRWSYPGSTPCRWPATNGSWNAAASARCNAAGSGRSSCAARPTPRPGGRWARRRPPGQPPSRRHRTAAPADPPRRHPTHPTRAPRCFASPPGPPRSTPPRRNRHRHRHRHPRRNRHRHHPHPRRARNRRHILRPGPRRSRRRPLDRRPPSRRPPSGRRSPGRGPPGQPAPGRRPLVPTGIRLPRARRLRSVSPAAPSHVA